jgi:hypothetical protein
MLEHAGMETHLYRTYLVEAGWTPQASGGESAYRMDLGDRVLICLPEFKPVPGQLVVLDHAQVWVEAYARLKHALVPGKPLEFSSLVYRKNSEFVIHREPDAAFFEDMTGVLRSWAERIDVAAEIDLLAQDRPHHGLGSHSHLAALALRGDVARIEAYRTEIAAHGKAAALHPRVSEETIEKALGLARAESVNDPGRGETDPG